MDTISPEALWALWRKHAAERLDWEAEDLRAGGGSTLLDEDQRDTSAQAWSNAANKIRNMPMPPLPRS